MARSMSGRAGGILSYFTRHRTAANLLLVVLLVCGAAAAPNMRAQFFPDVIIDSVSVTTVWEGAGADETHVAINDIPDCGQLVDTGRPQQRAETRHATSVVDPPLVRINRVHSSELAHHERFSPEPWPFLFKNNG